MARPKKSAQEVRSERAFIRFTVAEREQLRSNAHKSGLSEAEFMRRRLLGLPVTTTVTRTDPLLIVALNRIGNNVNQLSRAVHTDRSFQQYWREIGEELRGVLHSALEGINE